MTDLATECSACGGWGALAFGAGPWGAGGGGIENVLVESPTQLRVLFDVAPRALSHMDSQDILRAGNWTLQLISPPVGVTPMVQWVERVNAYEFLVLLDTSPIVGGLYGGFFADTVEPASLGLLDCRCFQFVGVGVANPLPATLAAAAKKERITDIANPYTERDAGMVGAPLSTFQRTATGDFALDSGLTGLRKRLWRRLTNQPGGFYHLPSDYGLAWKQKGLIRKSQLYELQARAQEQALLEPDVIRATVELQRPAPSVIILLLRAYSTTGEEASVGLPFTLVG